MPQENFAVVSIENCNKFCSLICQKCSKKTHQKFFQNFQLQCRYSSRKLQNIFQEGLQEFLYKMIILKEISPKIQKSFPEIKKIISIQDSVKRIDSLMYSSSLPKDSIYRYPWAIFQLGLSQYCYPEILVEIRKLIPLRSCFQIFP